MENDRNILLGEANMIRQFKIIDAHDPFTFQEELNKASKDGWTLDEVVWRNSIQYLAMLSKMVPEPEVKDEDL